MLLGKGNVLPNRTLTTSVVLEKNCNIRELRIWKPRKEFKYCYKDEWRTVDIIKLRVYGFICNMNYILACIVLYCIVYMYDML